MPPSLPPKPPASPPAHPPVSPSPGAPPANPPATPPDGNDTQMIVVGAVIGAIVLFSIGAVVYNMVTGTKTATAKVTTESFMASYHRNQPLLRNQQIPFIKVSTNDYYR